MNKKSFWKRTNRGFLVSLALIVCVLIYVLVTQLSLLSVKNELKTLAGNVRDLGQSLHILSDEKMQALQDDAALSKEKERVRKELEALFDPSSDYLDKAVDTLFGSMPLPDGMTERTRSAEESKKPRVRRCTVDGDVATIQMIYTYTVTGDFFNNNGYRGEGDDKYAPQPAESATEEYAVSMICKKVNDQWKIFRISDAYYYSYDRVFKEGTD